MLVETVCERKSAMALQTKMEAVVMAKISNANHAHLSNALEVWTYFHPCKEVSWQYFMKDAKARAVSLSGTNINQ